jgi:predicted KAP-like P-loop ATPase
MALDRTGQLFKQVLKDEINALTEMLLMRDLEPPVAVGILGGWGGGKSYIMHLMQTHMTEIRSQGLEAIGAWGLKDADSTSSDGDRVGRFVGHIYQIKFDAWTYAKSNLWASLMQTIFFELDRQISLEQKLQDALQESGISPLDSQSGEIWQALYETSDEDRQWFLENTLDPKALEKWKQNSHIQSDNDQLWDLFATSQAQALDNLKEIESKLKEKQDELHHKSSRNHHIK